MTKKEALTIAINTIDNDEAKEVIQNMINQLSVKRVASDEAKAKASEKRKTETAAKRAELIATVEPVIRAAMSSVPMTAKEIYEAAKDSLPSDFTAAKVQNVLLREMASSIVKVDGGRNANTYHL